MSRKRTFKIKRGFEKGMILLPYQPKEDLMWILYYLKAEKDAERMKLINSLREIDKKLEAIELILSIPEDLRKENHGKRV